MTTTTEREHDIERDMLHVIISEIPWVSPLESPEECDGIKWKNVALRDLFEWGPRAAPRPPRGLQPRALCRHQAHYVVECLEPNLRRDGTRGTTRKLCWWHLVYSALYGDMDEEARTTRWLRKYYPELFRNV